MAGDTALERSVGVDLRRGLGEVGGAVEGGNEAAVRAPLIPVDLTLLAGATGVSAHRRRDLVLREVPPVEVENHLPCGDRAEDVRLLCVELHALVR